MDLLAQDCGVVDWCRVWETLFEAGAPVGSADNRYLCKTRHGPDETGRGQLGWRHLLPRLARCLTPRGVPHDSNASAKTNNRQPVAQSERC